MTPHEATASIGAFLGFILILSGAGKLLDRAGTTKAIHAYGAPAPLAPVLARVLAPLEVLLGCGLVVQVSPIVFSFLGSVVLLATLGGVVSALRGGQGMDCHCFGILTREAVGSATLIRASALFILMVAALASELASPAGSLLAWPPSGLRASDLIPIALIGSATGFAVLLLGQFLATRRQLQHSQVLRSPPDE